MRSFKADNGALTPEPEIPSLRVPTVTCKSPVRPEGAEAEHEACGSSGGDVRDAILSAGSGNPYPLSALEPGVVTWVVRRKGWHLVAQATVRSRKLRGRQIVRAVVECR